MSNIAYDRIGTGYNSTRKADPYLCERMKALLPLPHGAQVLDVGCGTGNYTIALHDHVLHMVGVDPSDKMLTEARKRSGAIEWVKAAAEDLPFSDASFCGALATLTTHHWQDLRKGFQEIWRVLRPEGKLVLFTSTPEQMQNYWLCHYFPEMMDRSMRVMPSRDATMASLIDAGFSSITEELYAVRPDLKDLFLYAAKDDPLRYLDPVYRRGISSFSALADDQEVNAGLDQLRKDVESGAWKEIHDHYMNGSGDYLFIVATRT